MWLCRKDQTSGVLEFDLGQTQPVEQIFVWNYNAKNRTYRGVKQADISVWTPENGWRKILDDFTFSEGAGNDDYDEPVGVPLEGVQAQKIRFDELLSFGDLRYVGLSKVQFFAPRGPQALHPQPAAGHVTSNLLDVTLRWTPGKDSQKHRVYFGPDPDHLKLLCETEQNFCSDVPSTRREAMYYWRVDEVQEDKTVVKGDTWNFETGKLCYHWKLDETQAAAAQDAVGSRQGKLIGNPQWQAEGKVNGALAFDGEDDSIVVEEDVALDGWSALTVCMWIKSNQTETDQGFIIFEDPNNDDDRNMRYDAKGSRKRKKDIIALGVATTQGTAIMESSAKVQTTDWQHVAMVWQSGEAPALYINGERNKPSAPCEPLGGVLEGYTKILLGKGCKDQENKSWNGCIDDVRIYNCALTEPELAALHSGTSPAEALQSALAAKEQGLAPGTAGASDASAAATGEPIAGQHPETAGKKNNWIWVIVIIAVAAIIALATRKRKPTSRS